jgi:hypothetical protein
MADQHLGCRDLPSIVRRLVIFSERNVDDSQNVHTSYIRGGRGRRRDRDGPAGVVLGVHMTRVRLAGAGDFIVDGTGNPVPVRLICSESPLRKEWEEPADLLLAYVWLLPARTRIFLMSYKEAAAVLGGKALGSSSFRMLATTPPSARLVGSMLWNLMKTSGMYFSA